MSESPLANDGPPLPGTLLPSHYRECYGCGPELDFGLRMETKVGSQGTIVANLLVTDAHQGAPGLIHGGVLAAAFDESLGALSWLTRTPAVTARLETDFRRPIPVGSDLRIEAWIESENGRKSWRSAVATFGGGDEAARAHGLFVEVPRDHFKRHGRKTSTDHKERGQQND